MRRTLILAVAIATTAVVAGCSPTSPEPTSTNSPPADAAPTEAPTVEALTIPDCEMLLPIDVARTTFGDSVEFMGEGALTDSSGWFELPEITTALADAPQGTLCTWGAPNSDGSFTLHVAETDNRAELEAALPGAGFTPTTMGTVTAYEATGEDMVSTIAATHLFTGNVWIMSNATSLATTGEVAGSALDALRSANPTAGL